MALALGVDTGGTYTDAVLIRDEAEVVASAKALTTRHDLSVGIGNAVAAVLDASGEDAGDVALAALSTTLATNALVEGQGGRIGLILIGFREADMERQGLRQALAGDPFVSLSGGHDHAGGEAAALDKAALRAFLDAHGDAVSGFAVAAQFATRNPGHELRASEIIREVTGRPVTCSHQLSSKLGGPKRALTAVLNARLIGMIDRLIADARTTLDRLGVHAPLMVVRGDGALIGAGLARERPIETILSGPAASIVGARWLTGATDALVSDIGGTTTDIAVLRGGRPAIDPDGARVGPYRTMVEAVAMRTFGLGGDSECHVRAEGLAGGVHLGPRRTMPVSLMAVEAPEMVHAALERQLRATAPGEYDARFARAVPGMEASGLGGRDAAVLARLAEGPLPLGQVLKTRLEAQALSRLVGRGLVQVAGVTPSDAAHVLGWADAWDREAATKALELVARKRIGSGDRLAPDAKVLARMIVDQLTEQTKQALLETAFAEEARDFGAAAEALAAHPLMQAGLERYRGLVAIEAGLNCDVIGLGASAATYYPAVGARLRCRFDLPEHGGVANAIGAVTGRVTIRKSGTVTSPSEGRFRVHLEAGPEDFADSDAAMQHLEQVLRDAAQGEAEAAGAEGIRLHAARELRNASAEGRDVFLEGIVRVEATGRPRIADG